MTRNIEDRLSRLGSRRLGLDRVQLLNDSAQRELLQKRYVSQPWQKRAKDKPYTRYVLGAMQAVDDQYTKISIETAGRVENQLRSALSADSISCDFRLQGSVPLNVHIRGVSDVDLLVLRTDFLTYNRYGDMARSGAYGDASGRTSTAVLSDLRSKSIAALQSRFYAANVDTSGSKAIKLSGGSLARPVDVVPAHWNDTAEYQWRRLPHFRGVTIFDSKKWSAIENLPFLHIQKIAERCDSVRGALRMAIRLCKNVKADAGEEGRKIELPSFDIAALMWHLERSALSDGSLYELSVLAAVQEFLDRLYHDDVFARSLETPDGLRKVIDTPAKYGAVRLLSFEFDHLLKEVARECDPYLFGSGHLAHQTYRDGISAVYIPSA